jgi:uncharacterized protein (DUF4415 family)
MLMNEKLQSSNPEWIDPGDAPELTEEFFEHGEWKIGDRVVSPAEGTAAFREALKRGRPKAATKKVSTTIRLDTDVLEAFRSTGHGWQTRINSVLRAWLKESKSTLKSETTKRVRT